MSDKIDHTSESIKLKIDMIDRDRLRDSLTVEKTDNNILKVLEFADRRRFGGRDDYDRDRHHHHNHNHHYEHDHGYWGGRGGYDGGRGGGDGGGRGGGDGGGRGGGDR